MTSRTALLAVSLLVFGACSGEDPSGPRPRAVSPSSSSTPTSTHVNLPEPGTTDAESDPRFSVVDLPQIGKLDGAYLLAAGDGAFVATEPGTDRLDDSQLSLLDPAKPDPVRIERLPSSPPQQVIAAALNERWVVWQEHPGDSLDVSSWTLYAYDRTTGETQAVVSAAGLAGLPTGSEVPTAPGYSVPSLAGDSVYLSALSKAPRTTSVFRIDLQNPSSKPRRIASGRGGFVNGRDVVYLTRAAGDIEVVARSLSEGKARVLARVGSGCSGVSAMAGGHGTVAWIMDCGDGDIVTVRTGRGREWTVRAANLGYLRADGDVVTFAQATADGNYVQYVLLGGSGEVLQLGTGTVAGDTVVAGDVIAWRRLGGRNARSTTTIVRCSCG